MKYAYARGMSLLLALTFLAASCAQPPPTTAPPPGPPGEPVDVIDCGETSPGDTITMIYQWTGAEEEKINAILAPFTDACGVAISAEATRDEAVLDTRLKSDPPDVLFWPSTAPAILYPDQIRDLHALGANTDNYADFWIEQGTMAGGLVYLPAKVDIKSIIWYSPARFEIFGYSVPKTFEELDVLVEQMVADGNVPWSMGFESGASTGWTGSDFIQDLLLVQQGPDYVLSLINGSIPYDDAGVRHAYETYVKWASDPAYTVGGASGTLETGFVDAIVQVFASPAKAMMVKQSGFAGGEIVERFPSMEFGVDYGFFTFPGIKGMQGGADFLMATGDSNATAALIDYLTGNAGGQAWAETGFDLSPNTGASGHYIDPALAKKGDALANASGFTPDLGDTIPSPFGVAEWKAIIDAVQGVDLVTALGAAAAVQAEVVR